MSARQLLGITCINRVVIINKNYNRRAEGSRGGKRNRKYRNSRSASRQRDALLGKEHINNIQH